MARGGDTNSNSNLSGRLRWPITIQDRPDPETQDKTGGPIEQWSDLAVNVMAEVLTLAGSELLAAREVQAETTHLVTIRWRPGLTFFCRVITHRGHVLYIRAVVDPDNQQVMLKLYCVSPTSI